MLSEEELVRDCKEYKIDAQKELYIRYSAKMKTVCYYYTGSVDDAKDLMHEGFIKVYSSIHSFKGNGSLEGWIRKIMVNISITFALKKNKKRFIKFDENTDVPDESEEDYNTLNDFTEQDILEVITKLPDEERIVFNMYCLENKSHREISEITGIREDNCRNKLRRARILLRKYLDELTKK